MGNNLTSINANSLSQNRAEEFGFDLYQDFVLPPIYEKIDFAKSSKSKIFIGGRGCGKTMLLRYLSHETLFSINKPKIGNIEFENIGLYWKVDTHLVHLLQKRGVQEDVWFSAFEHLITLKFSLEILKCLESIAISSFTEFSLEEFSKIEINNPLDSNNKLISLKEFRNILNKDLRNFQIWLRNVRKQEYPDFYPIVLFQDLVSQIKNRFSFLEDSRFNLYIDEYENLTTYQKRIVNTLVKHSETPVVFHLAMKRNAFETKETTGNESLSHVHDYRIYDLEEDFDSQKEFRVFAAEIILHRLKSHHQLSSIDVNVDLLTDPNRQKERKNEDYRKTVLGIMDQIFPSQSYKELANEILDDKSLRNKLVIKLKQILKNKELDITPDKFFYLDDMRVTIVCLTLLHRDNISVDLLLKELVKVKNGEKNKFFDTTEWVNNNFIGSYLLFYSSLNRICPLYAGFKAFCQISNGNIRHLTELCYKTFLRASDLNSTENVVQIWQIDTIHQAQAAKQASATFLNEIKTFGQYGNQLHTFVLRVGTLFSIAHKNPKQSEPEQNHFSISTGGDVKDFQFLLDEAVKWSVLFQQKSTKKKTQHNPDLNEYVLNPIYAPYFHISFRKKRKIELSSENMRILITGTLDEFEILLKKYKGQWNVEQLKDGASRNLFSDLNI